jgi:hypothetical protein
MGARLARIGLFLALIVGAAVGCTLGPARAQIISGLFPDGVPGYAAEPGVTVASRARPAFDPQGLRAGSFVLWPQVEETVGVNNNVLGGSPQRGSWMLGTSPSLRVASGWARDSLGAYLGLTDMRYFDLPAQGRTDWTGSVGGEVSVGRDSLTLAVAHLALHEDRTELDALPSDQPIAYWVNDVRAAYALALNRWSVTPAVDAATWRFGDTTILGVPASQSYRDRNVLQGSVTARYEAAAQRDLVVVLRGVDTVYVAGQPGVAAPDSISVQALAGIDYAGSAVWRYRLLAGFERRSFAAAAAYPAHTAPLVEGEVAWSPSGLTTLTGTVTRAIEDAAQAGVAGYTYTGARLRIDHEVFRNVLLQVSGGLQRAAFLGGGVQTGLLAGAGATWLINRQLRLSATYDFTDSSSSGAPAGLSTYARDVALLTLRVAL